MTTGPKYNIEEDTRGDIRLVTVTGEIDLASAPALERSLTKEPEGPVVADLSDVGFIDSTGLRSLLSAQDIINNDGGRLVLVYGEGPVERILDLTRLNDRFESHPDVESASRALE